ncbi:helix-turn-helix domain-containing protein [Streptomyces sp. MP131-18]|uniref:helix-turn-helix transcriptional regulator n=1 Tax=Streptomyces sp. MP131-18 TaxID=1857892 RepID=UPI00097BAA33|nr:helix-turn-helix domain-containing protein [Streptomyces sp. MP131-18]
MKTTAKGADAATRFNVRHWRALLPVHVIALAGLAAAAANLAVWIWGPWAWVFVLVIAATVWVWIDGIIGDLDRSVQAAAAAQLMFGTACAVAFTFAATWAPVWGVVVAAGMILAIWWWSGDSLFTRYRSSERRSRKMGSALHALGACDATRVTSVNTNKKGDVEYRVFVGDADRPEKFRDADIAHQLHVDASRVIARRVSAGDSRRMKIIVLHAAASAKRNVPHPALERENRAKGAAWAPGSRDVLEGLPIGRAISSVEDRESTAGIFTSDPDAKCLGIFGISGSGKTNTSSSLLLSAIACGNLIVAGADPVKFDLGKYHAAAMHRRARTIDEVIADLEAIEVLSHDRIQRLDTMKDPDGNRMRNWIPTREHPGLLYLIDELTVMLSQATSTQADRLTRLLESLPKHVRQAGISIAFITQSINAMEIPTTLTSQYGSNFIGHQVKKGHDGDVQGWSVDVTEKGLPTRGQCWVGNPDGGDPTKTLAYDADSAITKQADEWDAMIAEYAAARPALSKHEAGILGWPQRAGQDQAAEAAVEPAEAAQEAPAVQGLGAEDLEAEEYGEVDLADVPEGEAADLDTDALAEVPHAARVVTALRTAGAALSIAALTQETKVPKRTLQRLLGRLADDGLVVREGASTATVYRLAA